MKQNKFDIVMDYIDANILEDADTLRKGIYKVIGYNSIYFENCFKVLTGQTLFHYISARKIFFAVRALVEDKNRPIVDIALEYRYSEQSAFTRAVKTFYHMTPNEVRKTNTMVPDNKYCLRDICEGKGQYDNKIQCIVAELQESGNLSTFDWNYIEQIEEAQRECGFDVDTCSAIFDLSERLEIPFGVLLDKCKDMVLDYYCNPDYPSPRIETMIGCGIQSDEELEEICTFYHCKHYDLDWFMVNEYRKQLKLDC